jgi:hypothetical protein
VANLRHVFLRAVVGLWGDAKAFCGKGESGLSAAGKPLTQPGKSDYS